MSPVHNHEPQIATHGLKDGCPRCEQLADDPRTISPEYLRGIWYGWEEHPERYRGQLNVRVVNHLERAWRLAANMGWHQLRGFRDRPPLRHELISVELTSPEGYCLVGCRCGVDAGSMPAGSVQSWYVTHQEVTA